MNSPLCWRISIENEYEFNRYLKLHSKYSSEVYISARFEIYPERSFLKLMKRFKIIRVYISLVKMVLGFRASRRHLSQRKDIRVFIKQVLLSEGFFKNLSQATVISLSKRFIVKDKPHTLRSIPMSCESLSLFLKIPANRLFGGTSFEITIKSLQEFSELPRIKKIITDHDIDQPNNGLDMLPCYDFFLKRIFPKLEQYESRNCRLGTAYSMLHRKPSFNKLRILGLTFVVIFDMGQELQNLKKLFSALTNLSVLKLEFSGESTDINYQFSNLVDLTTEQKLETLKFIPNLRSTMKKSQELTGYPILSKNLTIWNNRLEAYTRLRNLELTYEFAPYDLFHNNNSFEYFRFSKLQSLVRLKLNFNFHHNSEVNQMLLYSLTTEISAINSLRQFIFVSSRYLTDSELFQIVSLLRNRLEQLNILSSNDHDFNIRDRIKGDPITLSSLSCAWMFTDEEKTKDIFDYIRNCQGLTHLEIRPMFSLVHSDRGVKLNLDPLAELSNLKSFKFSSDNEEFFSFEGMDSIKRIVENSAQLEALSLSLFTPTKNLKEIKSYSVNFETIKGLLYYLCYKIESLEEMFLNFNIQIEEESNLDSLLAVLAMKKSLKYLSLFLTCFQLVNSTSVQDLNKNNLKLVQRFFSKAHCLQRIENLHLGLDYGCLKRLEFFSNEYANFCRNFYHLKRVGFGTWIPTQDNMIAKHTYCSPEYRV